MSPRLLLSPLQLQSSAQVLFLFFWRPPGSEHQVLNPWVTIHLVVALLVGLAWIFIGFRPEKDFTEGQWEEQVLLFR